MQLLVVVERFCAIISIYIRYAFNNQQVGNTIINYKYLEKHTGKHFGGRTVNNKMVDFKEGKLMYTGINVHWS